MEVHPSLTAIFTPPSDCTDSYFAAGAYTTIVEATIPQTTACFAPGWTPPRRHICLGKGRISGLDLRFAPLGSPWLH
jgi:hypothetical protein